MTFECPDRHEADALDVAVFRRRPEQVVGLGLRALSQQATKERYC
jgi:hypothetical protein